MTSVNDNFSNNLFSLNEQLTRRSINEDEVAAILAALTIDCPRITIVTLDEYMALKNCVLEAVVSDGLKKSLTEFAIEYGSLLLDCQLQELDYHIKSGSSEDAEYNVDVIYVIRFTQAPWNIVPTVEQELGFLKHFYKLLHNEDYIELTEDFAECRRDGIQTGYAKS